ncbi:thiamine diphosphokinase [Chelativorans sp. AA-79]|uniref:thiamine diphosphokinase n=1 Tax=Chelativorans sp. AA-79 TaxID=3028735 RepID=UPI0023F961F4|nr:thiamine diphosphokinase [Chelativorans sp. AA-79]WEX09906.1 thiamine diphosphokinase [Chelativorans sp. AA-79]
MSRFSILLGGDIRLTPRLLAQVAGTRAIAADSGMRHADALGLAPELWLGDFDSVPEDMSEAFPEVAREVFPIEKDKTDGELAIDAALHLGATSLILVGAFGGARPDHAHLHLAQAVHLAETGIPTLLSSGSQEGRLLVTGERHAFDLEDGTLFSILAFTDLSGLTVEGAKWPLRAVDVPFGSSLVLSNVVRGELTVTLRQGRALLLADFFADEKV